ncbi:MAG: nucleotidyltransferase family protein [Methanobacterium sp.]|jgi:predicted nucleotidyltransferase
MKTLEEIKNILREQKNELKERYGVKKIGIFGSFARGEQKEISDVDILVEFERPIGLRFFELADYIEEILGINVDLLTPNSLKQKPLLWQSAAENLLYV